MGKNSAGLVFDLAVVDPSQPGPTASRQSFYRSSHSRQDSIMATHHSNLWTSSCPLDEPSFDNFDEETDQSTMPGTMLAKRPVPVTCESSPPIRSLNVKPSYRALFKHLRDLNGTWSLSKALSSGVTPALELQGFNFATRKAIIASPMNLWISQSHYPSQIFAKETTTSSIATRTERWYPPHNGSWSEWWTTSSAGMEGGYVTTKSRCRWAKDSELGHGEGMGYLTDRLRLGGEFLMAEIECAELRWKAKQIWFVDRGRLVRRVVTIGEGERRAETTLVYNFDG